MNDLAELMSRNPLKHTREDVATIVAEMRKQRLNFNLGAAAKAAKPAPASKLEGAGLKLDLDL